MAVPTATAERKRKIASKTYKHKSVEPWKCPECDSWVFVNKDFHAMLCKELQKHPALKVGAEKWYNEYKVIEAREKLEAERRKAEEAAKKPKKRKGKHAEDTESEVEEFGLGEGTDTDWFESDIGG